MVCEECESQRRRTQDLSCVGCAVDGVARIESVADVTHTVDSQLSLETVLATRAALADQGAASVSVDVLDVLEVNLDALPAAVGLQLGSESSGAVGANDRFGGASAVHGSTVDHGDVEVFPVTDDAGEEVPSEPHRRPPPTGGWCFLVPRPPRHASFRSGQQQTWPIHCE